MPLGDIQRTTSKNDAVVRHAHWQAVLITYPVVRRKLRYCASPNSRRNPPEFRSMGNLLVMTQRTRADNLDDDESRGARTAVWTTMAIGPEGVVTEPNYTQLCDDRPSQRRLDASRATPFLCLRLRYLCHLLHQSAMDLVLDIKNSEGAGYVSTFDQRGGCLNG